MNEQHAAAFICALAGHGVTAIQLEAAVHDLEQNLRLGKSIGRLATRADADDPTGYAELAATNLAYDYVRRINEANR